jgi:ribosomal protein L27
VSTISALSGKHDLLDYDVDSGTGEMIMSHRGVISRAGQNVGAGEGMIGNAMAKGKAICQYSNILNMHTRTERK